MKYLFQHMIRNYRITPILALASIGLITVACNTMEGLGTDIKHSGETLEDSAEKNKSHPPRPCPTCHRH